MMKLLLLNGIFVSCMLWASGQNTLNLQQAIEIGIKNNTEVLQSALNEKRAAVGWKQSRSQMLPTLNAGINHGFNYGRSIDPFTNGFIDQNIGFGNYGLNSNLLLFNGFSLKNEIAANRLGYKASQQELQQAKDQLAINITLAYLQVLSATEILRQSEARIAVTQKQVERLSLLNELGNISPSELYDLKGQLATEQVGITDSKNNLTTAKINLTQLLNIPYHRDLEIIPIDTEDSDISGVDNPEEIYESALTRFPAIQAAGLRTQSAERKIKSVHGQLFPVFSVGGSVNTNYSSVATQNIFTGSTREASSDYVEVGSTQYPVFKTQNQFDTRKLRYGDQLNNNLFYTIGLGISIPLFNNSRVRSQVKNSEIDLQNNQLIEKNTRILLQQAIERAYADLIAAIEKKNLLQKQADAFSESFRIAEIKFDSGVINSVDFLTTKNNMDNAMTSLISAKYDLMLRKSIIDYYNGNPLW